MAMTDRPVPVPPPGRRQPGSSRAQRLFSDKDLMDNAEGDRKVLRRARELADQRNSRVDR